MLRRLWDGLLDRVIKRPKLGTPENPEILDPRLPKPSRVPIISSILKTMLIVSAPAIVLVWSSAWLVEMSRAHPIAWVPLLLLSPFTLSAALLAGVVDILLFVILVSTFFGRLV